MSNDPGDKPEPAAPAEAQGWSPQEEFTVPLPPATATQQVPQREPTRQLPVVPDAYAAQPSPYAVRPTADAQVEPLPDPLLEKSGVALVWIVDPAFETIVAYRPDGHPRLYHAGDTVEGEPHLPGFRVAVGRLFTR